MKKIIVLSILALSITAICSGQSNQTESLTITTYYPAPYGVYRYLRLSPTNDVPSAPALSPGVIYYDDDDDVLRYYNKSLSPIDLGGGGGGGGGYWTYNSATKAINNTNTNGYVSISGVPAASGELLQVNGDMHVRDTSSSDSTCLYLTRNSVTKNSTLVFDTNGSPDKYRVGITGNPSSRFFIGNGTQEFVTVTNLGHVGIGTNNPESKLHIQGNETGVSEEQTLAKLEGDGTMKLVMSSASNTSHDEPGIETYRARGSLSGARLALKKDDTLFTLRGYGGDNSGGYHQAGFIQGSADGDFSATSSPGRISFWTTPAGTVVPVERMVIKSDGKVGIGVGLGTNPPVDWMFQVRPTASAEGHVCADGSWAPASDKRLKKNISGIRDALAKIARVQGVRYDLIAEKSSGAKKGKHLGFIGQDLEKEFPEVVSTDSQGYKSVSYGSMTPVLVEAIKEQQNQIESLRKDLEELKAWK